METSSGLGLKNELLAALSWRAKRELDSELQPYEVTAGETLYLAGSTLRYVYFPVTAVISLFLPLKNGNGSEIAVVGIEGVAGVGALSPNATAIGNAVVSRSGQTFRVPASFMAELAQDPETIKPILMYEQMLLVTMAQTSVCRANHSISQQLCSWMLQHLDREAVPQLRVTQEHIASMLGTRRESITIAALKLQKEGLIRYSRGLIEGVDRKAIEDASCECYGVISRAFSQLIRVNKAFQCEERATS